MHLELLDPRTLMAVGLDTTFSGDGTLTSAVIRGTIQTTLSAGGALFVEERGNGADRIYKYDTNGNLDTTWGTNGSAPLTADINQMAYDATTGDLYAAGSGARVDGSRATLVVHRFLRNGQADARFGTNGVTSYTIAAPTVPPQSSESISARLWVQQLEALPGRQLLVGFERGISTTRDIAISSTSRTEGSVALLRLRFNGQRDNAFGAKGITPIQSFFRTSDLSEFSTNGDFDDARITDLVATGNGSYRVIATRTFGEFASSNSGNFDRTNAGSQIKSRLVNNAGVVSTTEAYSWNLLAGTTDQSQRDFDPLLAVADGRGTGVTVVGRYEFGGRVAEPLRAFQLTPGQRPAGTTPFSDTGIVATRAVRNPFGFYYVADEAGRVARYRPDFRRDVGFANRGVGKSDTAEPSQFTLVPDATNGRIFLADADSIDRLR